MNKMQTENIGEGLTVSIDYIAFTVLQPVSVSDVIMLMGFHPDDFVEMPRGGFGYKKQVKNEENGISVLYDGAEGMGIHVNCTGRAVGSLLASFAKSQNMLDPFSDNPAAPVPESVLSLFVGKVRELGKFTRLDAAIDDKGGKYFSPPEVFDLYENGQVVSKWRTVRRNDKRKAPRVCDGYTLYFGSRESALMLRLYDKKLEQNKNLPPDSPDLITEDWFRWELEFKEDRAVELSDSILGDTKLSYIIVGVLAYYLRIINLDSKDKFKCSNMQKWDDFLHGIKSLRLHVEKKVRSVYDKLNWIDSQVSPSLATLIMLHDFNMDFLYQMAHENMYRMSKSDWELIRKHKPDIYETYYPEEIYG